MDAFDVHFLTLLIRQSVIGVSVVEEHAVVVSVVREGENAGSDESHACTIPTKQPSVKRVDSHFGQIVLLVPAAPLGVVGVCLFPIIGVGDLILTLAVKGIEVRTALPRFEVFVIHACSIAWVWPLVKPF
jgi:hypothetical protein